MYAAVYLMKVWHGSIILQITRLVDVMARQYNVPILAAQGLLDGCLAVLHTIDLPQILQDSYERLWEVLKPIFYADSPSAVRFRNCLAEEAILLVDSRKDVATRSKRFAQVNSAAAKASKELALQLSSPTAAAALHHAPSPDPPRMPIRDQFATTPHVVLVVGIGKCLLPKRLLGHLLV